MKPEPRPDKVAIVINPSKFDDDAQVRQQLADAVAEAGHPEPAWYETSVEDPGVGQTRQALEDGAGMVVAVGGDGTVRSVAAALAGTGVPMGVVPAGTGNLLARSLKIPLQPKLALELLFAGHQRTIDVGRLVVDGGEPEVFLVMAGIGLDADVMVGVDDTLKSKIGWLAYVGSGLRSLFNRGFRVSVTADGSRRLSQHARSVLVGNSGELQGGVQLMPDALLDDGKLDVLMASPKGFLGWVALLVDVATRHHRGHPAVRRVQASRIVIQTRRPVEAQLDGDPVGAVRRLECTVDAGVLRVVAPDADAV